MAVLAKKLDAALVCSWCCILTSSNGGEKNREKWYVYGTGNWELGTGN
jgi:hypothetical protein